jgi:LAS superfamily LD-carboxypeptidase LdcB
MKATLANKLGQQLTGRTVDHVIHYKGKHRLHPETLAAFLRLQQTAKDDGFNLEIISSFRDYERQSLIWNRKSRGETTLLDSHSRPLIFEKLTADQIVESILRWSALPGTSRHHWGTDLDVFEASVMMPEQVQLVPQEYAPGGPFYELHRWLDEKIMSGNAEGFFRPYVIDHGGISPESWHLSHAPVAQDFFSHYDLDLYVDNIHTATDLELKSTLLARAEEFYVRYFKSIELP